MITSVILLYWHSYILSWLSSFILIFLLFRIVWICSFLLLRKYFVKNMCFLFKSRMNELKDGTWSKANITGTNATAASGITHANNTNASANVTFNYKQTTLGKGRSKTTPFDRVVERRLTSKQVNRPLWGLPSYPLTNNAIRQDPISRSLSQTAPWGGHYGGAEAVASAHDSSIRESMIKKKDKRKKCEVLFLRTTPPSIYQI